MILQFLKLVNLIELIVRSDHSRHKMGIKHAYIATAVDKYVNPILSRNCNWILAIEARLVPYWIPSSLADQLMWWTYVNLDPSFSVKIKWLYDYEPWVFNFLENFIIENTKIEFCNSFQCINQGCKYRSAVPWRSTPEIRHIGLAAPWRRQ